MSPVEASRKFIQTVRFILAVAVVMYLLVILRLHSSAKANPIILRAIGLVAITEAILIFVLRRIQTLPLEALLENQSQDAKVLFRWRQSYLVNYCLSLSIALYGLVLHFLGFTLPQIAPFFIAGFALIAFLGPRAVPSSTQPSQSGRIVPR